MARKNETLKLHFYEFILQPKLREKICPKFNRLFKNWNKKTSFLSLL